jgi:hypothetical protein
VTGRRAHYRLILQSEHVDTALGRLRVRSATAAAIPGAATAVLDGVADLAALENPPLVNTLIQDFPARA